MANQHDSLPAAEPDKESFARLFGDATALQQVFKADPALVKLIISNHGFLGTIFAHPIAFRAFLETPPLPDDLDQRLSGLALGNDGAALTAPRRPDEVRLAVLLRDPQATAFFRRQPELTQTLLSNPTFAEQVKVRHPRLYRELLDKAQERFGRDTEMAALIASEREGIIDFTSEGLILETPERRSRRENGMTLLEAVKNGHTDLARLLMEKGADPNARDELQQTPLHWAAQAGRTELARLLIEKGAEIQTKDYRKWTPLHRAAEFGHADLAQLLIEKGADLNAKDRSQRTPLHWATKGGHADLARLLIQSGTDLTAKDDWQRTPLHLAEGNGHTDLVKLLQDAAKDQPGHAGRVTRMRGNDQPQICG